MKMVVSLASRTEQRRLIDEAHYRCDLRSWQEKNSTDDGDSLYCGVTFDTVMCWGKTPAGTLAKQLCPDYINGFNKKEYAFRYCNESGEWLIPPGRNRSWTNFSNCEKPAFDIQYHTDIANNLRLLYTIGYSVSLSALVVAVIIMLCCRRLKSKSNILHINLFVAFICRASVSFLKDQLFNGAGMDMDIRQKPDGTYEFLDGPHWQCKLLFSLFNYTISASLTWIFIEGLYLHMLIYRTLSTERNGVTFYMVLGWVLPLFFVIPWVAVKATHDNTYCWNIQTRAEFRWILKGPAIAIVIINFIFFLDIFRILCVRARVNQRHLGKTKYKKLAKFILVLIPLFGLMYIILLVAFPKELTEDSYNLHHLYIEMGYNSFQGFILALLFCFLNEEVHGEIKKVWNRHQSRRADNAALTKSYGLSMYRKTSLNHSTDIENMGSMRITLTSPPQKEVSRNVFRKAFAKPIARTTSTSRGSSSSESKGQNSYIALAANTNNGVGHV